MIDLNQLKQHLHYDLETGIFTRLKTFRRVKKGDIAGCVDHSCPRGKKYIKIDVLGKYYRAHRLAWFYMTDNWPNQEIDHINHNSLDNSWLNLRDCSHKENGKNQKMYVNNSSGAVGVHLRESGKWRARIYVNKRSINIGQFDTFDEAVAARNAAQKEHKFHENHGKKNPSNA